MWGLLRILLLIGNAVYLALWVYFLISQPPYAHREWWEYLGAYGLLTLFALNLVYLLLDKGRSWSSFSNWRIFRLIGLWFDAKESELRQRADRRSRKDWED
jgi:hypothetical protein